jgi:tRNA (cmo5U34)-methyltransferase
MTKLQNDFNGIANVYDFLAGIVFGKSLKRAQTYFFSRIPENSNVLILGGGTGWIASELVKQRPSVKIVYVDASLEMISLARKRFKNSASRIQFIHGDEKSIPQETLFDVVITNFFLDLFQVQDLRRIVGVIKTFIEENGIWIVTDFVNEKFWHAGMLKIMYRFFHFTSNVSAKHLPDWKKEINENGFSEIESEKFFGEFMNSILYRRLSE